MIQQAMAERPATSRVPLRRRVHAAALLAGVGWLGVATATQAAQQRAIPQGFEELDEPQTAPVDVYFGARQRGSAAATFAPGWVELRDPAAIVALVPALRPESVAEVTAALTGHLATHSGSSCRPTSFPGCGTLDVPVAGVIFNPDYFRLDLVIAPGLLAEQGAGGRYLPDPVTGPSLLANLSGGGSGSSGSGGNVGAGVQSWLSAGRNALHLDAFAQTDGDRPIVNTLAAQRFGQDHLLSAGLIEDHGTRFSQVPALVGSRIETYLDTRLDRDTSAGSQILVFLPERSQVEIEANGRLVAVQTYDAGNQRLDTSQLPAGAYEVTLRIRGTSGTTREERVSFVKSFNFPPAGEWQYFVEGGAIADTDEGIVFPAVQPAPIVKAGVSRRLGEHLAGTLTLSTTDREALAESDLRFVLPQLTGGVQLAGASSGGIGLGADLAWQLGNFDVSASGELVHGADSEDEDRDWHRFGGLTAPRRSVSVSTGYNWQDGTRLRLRGYYRDSDGESWAIGPQLTIPLYRGRGIDAAFELGATYTDSEELATALITVRWGAANRPLQLSGNLGARWRQASEGDRGFGSTGVLGGSYRFDDVLGGATTLGGQVARDVDGTNRLSAYTDAETARGQLSAGVDFQSGADAEAFLYRGFARTTLVANADGMAIGGRQGGSDAAILARFDGAPDVGSLRVGTSSSDSTTVAAGSTAVLTVAPFQTYEPFARSAEDKILDLAQPDEAIPLYPGNVATARWAVRRLYSVYGRMVRADGIPVANARIEGVNGLGISDGEGYFVVEIEAAGKHRVEPAAGSPCIVGLLQATPPDGEDVIGVGDVVCRDPGESEASNQS